MTREDLQTEWLIDYCPKCANNDDRWAEYCNCQREEAARYMLQWQQELKDGGVPICSDKIQSLRVAIEALSERTGKWVRKDMYASRFCSKCDYAVGADESEEYNFCPSCGAMMVHKEK